MTLTFDISVYHVSLFRDPVDGKDDFKNDFEKSRTDIKAKSVYGPNRKIAQNVGTKNIFTPIYYSHPLCSPYSSSSFLFILFFPSWFFFFLKKIMLNLLHYYIIFIDDETPLNAME